MVSLNNLHLFFRNIELLVETNLKRLEKVQLSKLLDTKCYRSYRFKLGYQHMDNVHMQMLNQQKKLIKN